MTITDQALHEVNVFQCSDEGMAFDYSCAVIRGLDALTAMALNKETRPAVENEFRSICVARDMINELIGMMAP